MNNLFCKNCSQNFGIQDRIPRMIIQCGHTYCELCLQKFLDRQKFVCPIDKKVINLENKTIEFFPINQNLVDYLQINTKKKLKQKAKKGVNDFQSLLKQFQQEICYHHESKKDGMCTNFYLTNMQQIKKQHKTIDLRQYINQGYALIEELKNKKDQLDEVKQNLERDFLNRLVKLEIIQFKEEILKNIENIKFTVLRLFEQNTNSIMKRFTDYWGNFQQVIFEKIQENFFDDKIQNWNYFYEGLFLENDSIEHKHYLINKLNQNQKGMKKIEQAQDVMNSIIEFQEKSIQQFNQKSKDFQIKCSIKEGFEFFNIQKPTMTFESNLFNQEMIESFIDQNIDQQQQNNEEISGNFLKNQSKISFSKQESLNDQFSMTKMGQNFNKNNIILNVTEDSKKNYEKELTQIPSNLFIEYQDSHFSLKKVESKKKYDQSPKKLKKKIQTNSHSKLVTLDIKKQNQNYFSSNQFDEYIPSNQNEFCSINKQSKRSIHQKKTTKKGHLRKYSQNNLNQIKNIDNDYQLIPKNIKHQRNQSQAVLKYSENYDKNKNKSQKRKFSIKLNTNKKNRSISRSQVQHKSSEDKSIVIDLIIKDIQNQQKKIDISNKSKLKRFKRY